VPGPRAVLDVNLSVSWVLTAGPTLSRLFAAWSGDRFVALVSPPITAELRRVLERLPERVQPVVAEHLERFERRAERTDGEALAAGACRDPKDDKFLSCAVEGDADYVVTGDGDLLDMRTFQGVRIVTPREFLLLLEEA
jgi:putative PIN family toxin of toxin-antitoxin system